MTDNHDGGFWAQDITDYEGLWGLEMIEPDFQLWRYQFQVTPRWGNEGRWIIQLFSAATGEPSKFEIWGEDRLALCRFYTSMDDWRKAAQAMIAREWRR